MKIFLKVNLIILLMGLTTTGILTIDAASRTGHKEFEKITFTYNPEAKLLVDMSDSELNEMMKNVKKKTFGWSIYSKIKNYEVIYEAGTIFSRSNNTSQEINFNYNTASTTKQQFSFNLSGTLAMKTSGKIDVVSASLDKSIKSDIGLKSDISFEEEMDFTIKILPQKKVSLIVKGKATISSGANKYYFLGICTKKGYWEYVDVISEYYELYEEEIY
ncbi:MAG: hypothetical protein V8R15_02570 [Bacilli bacterium]